MEKIGLKSIKGFENYSVTECGKVFSHITDRFLKSCDNGSGYRYLVLRRDGKSLQKAVHRLVAETYLGENSKPVNHKDGDKSNNNISNLEFVTPSQNTIHGFKNGLMKVCPVSLEKSGIGFWFPTQKDCAEFFKVSRGCVNNLVKNRNKTLKGYVLS